MANAPQPRRGAPTRLPAGITLTNSGRYRARPTGSRGKRAPNTFDTLDEAKRYLRAQELAGRTVEDAIKEWMKERPLTVKATTLERDKQIIRNLSAWFTDMDLADVTESDLSRVVNEWPGKDGTRRRVRTTLQALFTWAVRKKILDSSPATNVRVAAKTGADLPNPFSWVEVDMIAQKIRGNHTYIADAMLLSAHTGLRLGELRALRVADYRDLPQPHLEVHLNHTETQDQETSTKSGKPRWVPLDPTAHEIVKRLSARRAPNDYLLTTPRGTQVRARNMRRAIHWDQLCPGHTWHDLRHTAAVEWMQHGLTSRDIQMLLGHASLETTERYLAGLHGTVWHSEISAKFREFSDVPAGNSWHNTATR